jgi:hypothetical protein
VRIALAPGEVALLRARDPAASRVLVTAEPGAANLLPLLDEALADPAWQGRKAEVVLSQHFVRHVLTPPPGKALARAEERALVNASLREIYGDAVANWTLQVHSQPPQYGLVGAALDSAFLQQLDALLTRHGFRDSAIRPLASVAARQLPKQLQGWWVLAEPGWLSLFAVDRGVWQYCSGQPAEPDWLADLPGLIARESGLASSGLASQPALPEVWIQGVGVGTVSQPAADRAHWHVLPHDNAARGALALAGEGR